MKFLSVMLALSIFAGNALASDEVVKAVEDGDIDLVSRLVKDGESANYRSGPYSEPLLLLTQGMREDFDMMKALVELGADVNATDKDGASALGKASIFGTAKSVEFLLKNGANPNHVDKDGGYPLGMAISKGRFDVVKLLVEHGADVNLATHGLSFGYSPLIFAVVRGDKDAVSFLVQKGANPNYRSSDGTAIEIAKAFGKEEIIRALSPGK